MTARRGVTVLGLVSLALLLLTLALGWGTATGRAALKTALFIPAVVPGVGLDLQDRLTPAPIHERVSFETPSGLREGDIYRPPGPGPFPAVLLSLGVAPAGPEDERVINLGQALSRSGMVVLWHWSPAFNEERIDEREVVDLVAAYQYLRARPDVDSSRVGMGGFCIGAAFVLMAASQDPIRDQVAFVNAFTPYYRMRDVLRAVASETQFDEDDVSPWKPDKLTLSVFRKHLLEAITDPAEAETVRRAVMEEGEAPALETLSPEAQAVYRILSGPSLAESEALIAALPLSFRERMERVSPASYIDRVEAPILVMHDRNDHLVPVEESRRLAAARRAQDLPIIYTEFSLFDHVTPGNSLGKFAMARELWKLFRHMHAIMLQAT